MRKQISIHLDNYLYLNKKERNGLIALWILSFCFLSMSHIYDFFSEKEKTDFSQFLNQIEVHQSKNLKNRMTPSQAQSSPILNTSTATLFNFDPNTASKEDFIKLGLREKTAQTIINFRQSGGYFYQPTDMKKVYNLSDKDFERIKNHIQIKKKKNSKTKNSSKPIAAAQIPKSYDVVPLKPSKFDPNTAPEKILLENGIPQKQVKMIIKYRTKGGKFYKKEDLKKIYGMPETVYNNLTDYIKIESTFNEKKPIAKASSKNPFVKKSFEPIQIDINKASAEEWQKLRGIGPAFSKRITKFRDALGGFYSINQVGETYGLPDSTFQSIKTQLVKSSLLKKININQASEEDLKKHPYISWKQAKLIASYRTMHGDFKLVEDLLQIQAFNQEWFDKVKYYLTK